MKVPCCGILFLLLVFEIGLHDLGMYRDFQSGLLQSVMNIERKQMEGPIRKVFRSYVWPYLVPLLINIWPWPLGGAIDLFSKQFLGKWSGHVWEKAQVCCSKMHKRKPESTWTSKRNSFNKQKEWLNFTFGGVPENFSHTLLLYSVHSSENSFSNFRPHQSANRN